MDKAEYQSKMDEIKNKRILLFQEEQRIRTEYVNSTDLKVGDEFIRFMSKPKTCDKCEFKAISPDELPCCGCTWDGNKASYFKKYEGDSYPIVCNSCRRRPSCHLSDRNHCYTYSFLEGTT